MESLMREITAGVPGAGDAPRENETDEEKAEREQLFKAAWEAMLIEGMDGQVKAGDVASGSAAPEPANDFQKTVRAAMDKMKTSEDSLKQPGAGSGGQDDSMAALLEQFSKETPDEDFAGMLEDMMGQLMTKEVLYEPLKELADKVRNLTFIDSPFNDI
jgi:peroxin-19